jgi:hypothetical protein
MKINEQEIRDMVREVVAKKLSELNEGKDFSARRQVVHSAKQASMEFEKEIVGLLGLEHPDNLPPDLQKRYYLAVEKMNSEIVKAVMSATMELAKFPKPKEEKPSRGR